MHHTLVVFPPTGSEACERKTAPFLCQESDPEGDIDCHVCTLAFGAQLFNGRCTKFGREGLGR